MSTYALARPGSGSRRAGVFAAVVLLHALVIGAFARALFIGVSPIGTVPLQVRIVAEPPRMERRSPPPLHAPPLAALQPALAPLLPMLAIRSEVPAASSPRAAGPARAAGSRRPAPDPPSTVLAFISGPANPQSFYPFQARLEHQQGTVLTSICVDAAGRIDSVVVVKSSGVYDLDRAALTMGKLTQWKAATVAGKPVRRCGELNIGFSLNGSVRF